MRLQSRIISIEYAGQSILSPGQYLAAETYGGSDSFTTQAEELLTADAVTVRDYGNRRGEMQLPVCEDFRSETEAFAAAMSMRSFVRSHQTGTLKIAIGSELDECEAGVQSFNWEIRYTGSGTGSRVRLTMTFNFILGGSSANIG